MPEDIETQSKETDSKAKCESESDAIDMLFSVGAYLKNKGLRKVELTLDNHSRLRIEIDINWVTEMNDSFRRVAKDGK